MSLDVRSFMTTFQRLVPVGLLIVALLSGCGTTAMDAESTREVVLQYLGADAAVGTAGPFHKGAKSELSVLAPGDRQKAEALLDRGAAMFLVYAGKAAAAAASDNAANSNTTGSNVNRVVFVQGGNIAGDFRAQTAGQ
jgi:hypothetical protein